MTHPTTLDELKQHITLLANIEETDAPFISCYLNLENGQTNWRDVFDERACILRRLLKGNDLAGQSDCPVEVVEQSDVLMALGGIGCLLRTQLDTPIEKHTAPAVASA